MIRVYLALALFLFAGVASAHTGSGHADRGEAYAHCQTYLGTRTDITKPKRCNYNAASSALSGKPGYEAQYEFTPGAGNWTPLGAAFGWGTNPECPAGKAWNDSLKICTNCPVGETSTGTARVGSSLGACNPATECSVTWTKNGPPYVVVGSDGIPVNWQKWSGVTSGMTCSVAPDGDGDGTPDTTDAKPTDPTEHADTDGDGIGDNADPMPNDPTNGEDTGVGDESDNTSNGGGTCNAPPSSSGDAIAAQIAYQTWATRCAVEKLNAMSTGNNGTIGGGGGGTDMTATNAKLDGIKTGTDALKDAFDVGDADLDQGSASGTTADIWSEETESPSFDMGGFGLSRSCPSPPTITLGGHTRTIDTDALCSLSEVIAALVIMMTAAHMAYIFAGRNS